MRSSSFTLAVTSAWSCAAVWEAPGVVQESLIPAASEQHPMELLGAGTGFFHRGCLFGWSPLGLNGP